MRRLPAALARVRRALGARRPGGPGPRPPPRRGGAGRRAARARSSSRSGRTAAPSCAARWPSCARAAPSTRTGTSTANRLVHPPRRPAAPLRRRGVARPARPQPGLRPLVVLVQLPRPDGRGREPAAAPPPRRASTRASTRSPVRRPCATPDAATSRAGPAPRLPVRGLRPRRGGRRLRRRLPARAGPARRRLLPGRRGARQRRARQARGHRPGCLEHAARGVRLRLLVAARARPGRLGSGSRSTTRSCSPTTAASWSGRSTTCSPRWTAAPATGGACRRRRWSSTRTTWARTRRCRSRTPSATWSDRAAGPRWTTCTSARTSRCSGGRSSTTRASASGSTPSCGQRTKQLVVDKYEIGISRYLMDSGFEFDTWAADLHPFHPLYSRRSFDLIRAGFPLVKRNFLAENPRDVPGLRRVAGVAARRGARGADRPDQGQHRPRLARRPDPARPEHRPGRAVRSPGTSPATARPVRLPMDGRGGAQARALVGLPRQRRQPPPRPGRPGTLRDRPATTRRSARSC